MSTMPPEHPVTIALRALAAAVAPGKRDVDRMVRIDLREVEPVLLAELAEVTGTTPDRHVYAGAGAPQCTEALYALMGPLRICATCTHPATRNEVLAVADRAVAS